VRRGVLLRTKTIDVSEHVEAYCRFLYITFLVLIVILLAFQNHPGLRQNFLSSPKTSSELLEKSRFRGKEREHFGAHCGFSENIIILRIFLLLFRTVPYHGGGRIK
jgi:hypothetical protein